ncbi:uncharacterized protein [Eurosta solidaginis]|uniref:uncharacterized protein n=1 Tax=Eurosta solidaginis TaxID=178769 RepID=UPI00353069A3
MADNNSMNKSSSSEDEANTTMVAHGQLIEDLRQQIKTLQMSLVSSEKEKVEYKDALHRQTANNVTAADVPSNEAKPAGFKPDEVIFVNSGANSASTIHANFISPGANCTSTIPTNCITTSANFASTTGTCSHYNSGLYTTANLFDPASVSVNPANASMLNSADVNTANVKLDATSGAFMWSPTCRPPIMQPHCYTNNFYRGNFPPGRNFPPTTTSVYNPQTTPQEHPSWSPIRCSATRKILDLPVFHGSPEEWPMFSVAFKETTEMHSYSQLENLLRLQKALKGEARQRKFTTGAQSF